jgi:predicted metal-dependent HD superfamily phosphohydrolase
MEQRWAQLCERVNGAPGAASAGWLWVIVRALHEEPVRAYHNLSHVRACLDGLDAYTGAVEDRDAVELALWFHDSIYESRRSDNEACSAATAEMIAWRLGMDKARRRVVHDLVMATAHKHEPRTGDEAVIMDLDLSILGLPWPAYTAYTAAIRAEYAWADDDSYRRGRAAFLQGMLAKPAVFHNAQVRERLETAAHANMQRELVWLESGASLVVTPTST